MNSILKKYHIIWLKLKDDINQIKDNDIAFREQLEDFSPQHSAFLKIIDLLEKIEKSYANHQNYENETSVNETSENFSSLSQIFFDKQSNHTVLLPKFFFNERNDQNKENENIFDIFYFSENLANVLGFEINKVFLLSQNSPPIISKFQVNFQPYDMILIYTNFNQPQIITDTEEKQAILNIIPIHFNEKNKFGDYAYITFDPPIYTPVISKKDFEYLNFDLRDKLGNKILFDNTQKPLELKLHFRPIKKGPNFYL